MITIIVRVWDIRQKNGGRGMVNKAARWRIWGCIGVLLLDMVYFTECSQVKITAAKESSNSASHEIYEKDDRLEAIEKEEGTRNSVNNHLYYQHLLMFEGYDEEEIAQSRHASFDEKKRLLYALGYNESNILSNERSYCEENVYEWDDTAHTCRTIYYKSTSVPYNAGFYVAYRYMYRVNFYQLDEKNRLLSKQEYSRNVGSDPLGYSEELFYSLGYQAQYDGDKIMEELQYRDYWGTNETGFWWYWIYQYDDQGNCILRVETTEDEIILYCFEYDEKSKLTGEYRYLVKEDWELSCDDGSTYYFRPQWGKPAVKKIAADKTVERELYYGKAMDMGQQHYLMPEEVEETVFDHKYKVKPGDCLTKIAYRQYGDAAYYDLLYRINRDKIGFDRNFILPGTWLVIPEIGNEQNTKKGTRNE